MFTFVESSTFGAIRPSYMDDDEYAELQNFMMHNPESGNIVPGSGASANSGGSDRAWESVAGFG